VGRVARGATLVEFGGGSATNTRLLIDAMLRRQPALHYVPIDMAETMLTESSRQLLKEYPTLTITAVLGDYEDGLTVMRDRLSSPKLILWLGSNIGNFHRREAAAFLSRVRETMSSDDSLLLGVDLRKERTVLELAYNDSAGVTAAFNKNLLARINRELGGRFDMAAFEHRATYDEQCGRIEMYLVSRADQNVPIDALHLTARLAAGEAIHTEYSYKYAPSELRNVLDNADLVAAELYFDKPKAFLLVWATRNKQIREHNPSEYCIRHDQT
jgi:L-histidine N-alpha-methyltransferase